MSKNKSTRRFFRVAALMALALAALPLIGQTNAPKAISDRYLFIVDTSSAMRRRAPAVEKAVENLMQSSMAAQLEHGDTVGVWTFDEQLHAGQFPLLVWSPEREELAASNIVAFLKARRYQKRSHFEVVVPALKRIIEDSPRLTVLLVSDGDEKISGTPFDKQIAGAFAENFKKQQKARMPFITVLRTRRGQFINASVNLAPWPVEFRDFPPEPVAAEKPKPKLPEKKPEPKPTVPPLIVIGKKRESPPATTAPAATNAVVVAPATNTPPKTETTATTIISRPPQASPGETTPAPAPVAPVQEAVKPPESANPTSVPPATAVTVVSQPVPETKTPLSKPAEPATVAQSEETPMASATNESASTNPPADAALAVETEPGFSRVGLIAISGGVLLLVAGLFLAMRRRGRHATDSSLITHSMDRNQK